ncbi:hypothetical protein GTA08_BOTSDO02537 [Botryosphaeria dothidea]|uniref:Mannose-1-phosphate guanylyltransferase n=1 Tax=Botryosphaeria dothidea TaxID=55169 RepID=A0A8H4IZW0_9PEZI|nr:hypothetical protein GTA08_BOTSDO02537 [Botryosphaeria dothidea]
MACRTYNQMPEDATVEQRSNLWRNIVTTGSITPPCEDELTDIAAGCNNSNPFSKGTPYVKPPVYIDYGTKLLVGASTFINRNFTVCDTPVLPVRIGERCLIGPNTSIYAVGHPLDYRERAGPLGAPSLASSVTIEDDCWIGGNVIIMPGVRIGRGCVIGAGSVVTKDVPPEHLAYGNPARVIRRLVEDTAESENVQDQQISPVRLSPDSDASAAVKGDPTKTTTPTTPPPSACSSCSCPSASAPLPLSSPPSYLSSRYPVLTAQSGLLQALFLLIGLALIFRYFA